MKPSKSKDMQGSIVALNDPYHPGTILFRRVIATENMWVKRKDDGGIIKVPKGHVWLENVSFATSQEDDSLTKFGPLSQSYLHGKVFGVVWPLWRVAFFDTIE